MIKIAETDNEIADCFPTMQELRPELVKTAFVPLVRELMHGGFQLAYLREQQQVACVAGFRISKNLFLGKHLYIDDLSTLDSHRSKGHGEKMMIWLRDLAKAKGCNAIHLDSGVQRHRAHKFYLNRNMVISSYHFLEKFT